MGPKLGNVQGRCNSEGQYDHFDPRLCSGMVHFELSDFERDELNNDPGMKSWINTLSQRFKIPTSVALGPLTDDTYFLEDARRCRPPPQYTRAIMHYSIGCNIIEVANQLFFAY